MHTPESFLKRAVIPLMNTYSKLVHVIKVRSLVHLKRGSGEGNSSNFRDFSCLATATNIVLPLDKPKNSLNFFYNT